MKIDEALENIYSKEDFLNFVTMLSDDYEFNKENWDNRTVNSYLMAIHSWIEDMEGYYENLNKEMPKNINWSFIAILLNIGRIYE